MIYRPPQRGMLFAGVELRCVDKAFNTDVLSGWLTDDSALLCMCVCVCCVCVCGVSEDGGRREEQGVTNVQTGGP